MALVNLDLNAWSKQDCFASVLLQYELRFKVALARYQERMYPENCSHQAGILPKYLAPRWKLHLWATPRLASYAIQHVLEIKENIIWTEMQSEILLWIGKKAPWINEIKTKPNIILPLLRSNNLSETATILPWPLCRWFHLFQQRWRGQRKVLASTW